MSLFSASKQVVLLLSLALLLPGCSLSPGSSEDELKDPYYLQGKSRYSSMDYDGAIAAFENALTSNPKSAAAHLELGFLNEERKSNYAAAIYHFDKHLELKPKSPMADTVRQHISSCKIDLARTVPFALISRQVQEELRRLTSSNAVLAGVIEQLKADLVQQAVVYSNRLAAVSQVSFATPPPSQMTLETEHHSNAGERPPSPVGSNSTVHSSAAPRTHVVKPGETMALIARKYNLKLSSLQAANPGVEPRKLKAGQTLNLPGRY